MTAPVTPADEPAPDVTATDVTEDPTTGNTHWEPEVEDGDVPEDPTPEGDQPVTTAPGAIPAATTDAAVTPLRVRADGAMEEIPGAFQAPEGIYIPKEHQAKVISLLSRGIHHDRGWRQQLGAERNEARRQTALREVDVAKATVYTKKMEEVFSSEEAFMKFAENLNGNLALLNEQINNAETTTRLRFATEGIKLDTPYNVLSGDELLRNSAQSLVDNYNDLLQDAPEVMAAFPDEASQNELFTMLLKNPTRYVVQAPQDMADIGVRKGDYVIDRQALSADMAGMARFRPAQQSTKDAAVQQQDRAKVVNAAVATANTRPPVKKPAPDTRDHTAHDATEWRRKILSYTGKS